MKNISSYFIRFGEADLSVLVDESFIRNVINVLTHPNYIDGKPYFDVGFAIAREPFQFNKFAIPICLPLRPVDDVDYLEGDLVTMSGWGTFYDKSNQLKSNSKDLKLINLRVYKY